MKHFLKKNILAWCILSGVVIITWEIAFSSLFSIRWGMPLAITLSSVTGVIALVVGLYFDDKWNDPQ